MNDILVVFTAKNANRLEQEGGSSNWALSERKAQLCRYVICTRNSSPPRPGEAGTISNVPHGAAFLVGRVSGLVKTTIENGRQRYRLLFDQVADVLIPNFLGRLACANQISLGIRRAKQGIDLTDLDFRPIDGTAAAGLHHSLAPNAFADQGISIEEAKTGLALRFKLKPSQIDIVIRG